MNACHTGQLKPAEYSAQYMYNKGGYPLLDLFSVLKIKVKT